MTHQEDNQFNSARLLVAALLLGAVMTAAGILLGGVL